MPEETEGHRKDGEQHSKGCKKHTDLRCLTRGNHIGGEILENILKRIRTLSQIILSTGHLCDLGECFFIDLPSETSTQTTSPKIWTKPTKGIIRRLIATIHR